MPVARYFLFVGGVLLALLFALDAFAPQPVAVASNSAPSIDKTVVRIRSDQKPPERVVYDMSLPTIVPPAAKTQVAAAPVPDISAQARVRDTFAQFVPAEAKKLEKESTLQKAVSDYDRFVQDFWGPNGKVQRLNDEITREVIGKVRDAVELLANREGYDLVLDAADGNVIFGVKSLDLTQRVLDELNKSTVGGTTN